MLADIAECADERSQPSPHPATLAMLACRRIPTTSRNATVSRSTNTDYLPEPINALDYEEIVRLAHRFEDQMAFHLNVVFTRLPS